jgi:hypothetical protein
MCVADCSVNASACRRFEETVCVSVSDGINPEAGQAYCFPRCTFGANNASKCGAREGSACELVAGGEVAEGFCRPSCSLDSECGGLRCDPTVGVCKNSAPEPWTDFGAECDPSVQEPVCGGLCVTVSETFDVCSNRCVFGSATPCMSDSAVPTLCAYVTPGGSIGDLGYCAELCDCDGDCQHPAGICDAFTDQSVVELLGKKGVCAGRIGESGEMRSGIPCQ